MKKCRIAAIILAALLMLLPAVLSGCSSGNGQAETAADGIPTLRVDGTSLVDASGSAVRIKGVSTHGLAWFPQFVDPEGFKTLRDEWGVNCIRLAMYTEEYGGYCAGGDRQALRSLIDKGVEYATSLGMYCIIDWHILSDGSPLQHQEEALDFFAEVSADYADHTNVLYEVCNEPNGGTDWAAVKEYAEAVIPVIRANDEDAVILIGTPTWSQDVDAAARDPISGQSNIMYTFHFYAGTHRQEFRDKVAAAVESGLPVFVSEFGISDASGNGAVDTAEGDIWLDFLRSRGISYVCWNLSNKDESSALISSSCGRTSGWTDEELSDEGRWYKSQN